MLGVKFDVEKDTARPALAELREDIKPETAAKYIALAVASLLRRYFPRLPRNKMGGNSTNFWQQAGDSVDQYTDGANAFVYTTHLGVRQRYQGGTIRPVNKKYLAIPANALAYGKTPSSFSTLHFVQFGRGQEAPKALVMLTGDKAKQVAGGGRGRGQAAPTSLEKVHRLVMFWLKDHVDQAPNPKVLPTDDEFNAAIEEALRPYLKK